MMSKYSLVGSSNYHNINKLISSIFCLFYVILLSLLNQQNQLDTDMSDPDSTGELDRQQLNIRKSIAISTSSIQGNSLRGQFQRLKAEGKKTIIQFLGSNYGELCWLLILSFAKSKQRLKQIALQGTQKQKPQQLMQNIARALKTYNIIGRGNQLAKQIMNYYRKANKDPKYHAALLQFISKQFKQQKTLQILRKVCNDNNHQLIEVLNQNKPKQQILKKAEKNNALFLFKKTKKNQFYAILSSNKQNPKQKDKKEQEDEQYDQEHRQNGFYTISIVREINRQDQDRKYGENQVVKKSRSEINQLQRNSRQKDVKKSYSLGEQPSNSFNFYSYQITWFQTLVFIIIFAVILESLFGIFDPLLRQFNTHIGKYSLIQIGFRLANTILKNSSQQAAQM